MARLSLTTLWGIGAVLCPVLSWGLGFGDLQVDSRLNQPFHARVEIVDVSDEDWRQIHTRIGQQTSPEEGGARPAFLESVTLRAAEDARHRHFIEMRSAEAFTEPLFDLPIEVAGAGLQMIRNYSVLLDPASAEDASQAPAELASAQEPSVPGVSSSVQQSPAPTPHLTAARQSSPHRQRHAHRSDQAKRGKLGPSVLATTPRKTSVAQSAATAAMQKQLKGQLATLEQMLTEMRQTLSTQDTEIARLTAKLKARATPTTGRLPSVSSPTPPTGVINATPPVTGAKSSSYYWIVALSLAAVLALILPRIRPGIGQQQPDVPAPRATSDAPAGPEPVQVRERMQVISPPKKTEPEPETDITVPLLALEEEAGARTAQIEQIMPGLAEVDTVTLADERSFINKEIAQVLEDSIGQEPDRVDIKIKLLEIYHHEVLGNRADFLSLLDKLTADPRALSPAQRSHVEKLQHTLFDGQLEVGTEFVARVAI